MKRTIAIMFTATLAIACGKKKDDAPATPPTPVGSGSAATAMTGSGSAATAMTGSGSAAAAVDVPTEMDFETQAKADVTDKTVEAKVKAIEDQLGK